MTDRPHDSSEFGFKIPNAENILDPDPLTKLMQTRDEDGFRPMAPNDVLRSLSEITLVNAVPLDVRRAYQMPLGAIAYAYWYYPLYTLAAQQLLRTADFALDTYMRNRGFEGRYALAARLQVLQTAGLMTENERGRWELIRRLRNSATHPNFQEIWGLRQAYDVAATVAEAINTLPWHDLNEIDEAAPQTP